MAEKKHIGIQGHPQDTATPQMNLLDFQNFIDPVQATFSGGAKDPFRRWYPYLEGYSPKFVETILQYFSPKAQTVFDPFGGTGTTAFVTARKGLKSYVCEVNPLMQFLFEIKVEVRLMDSQLRKDLSNRLEKLSREFPQQLDDCALDSDLLSGYEKTFGTSSFFDQKVFYQVLQARTFIDKVTLEDPIIARLLTVAILSSLIPCSLLQRSGDLRYKKGKELDKVPSFHDAVRLKLSEIIDDIRSESGNLLTEPSIISEDVRHLGTLPFLNIDTVITSPPYVNGTNYFRNTKVELWFLRCLESQNDLRYYRSRAITAGINDVTVGKSSVSPDPAVKAVVTALEKNAYDSRIPRMIASYFAELCQVFEGISKHMVQGGIVAIDIGDSNYGGVHVPVDELLVKCLIPMGFSLEETINLRKRRSKNGFPLKQVLLIFKHKRNGANEKLRKVETSWGKSWNYFKDNLPHQEKPYSKRNWGNPLHSLCSYQGKLKPSIAYHLVEIFVPEGGVMLDPFAGVGTIPFEAALQGKKAYGFDLSSSANIISKAKLAAASANHTAQIIDELEKFIENYDPTCEDLKEAETFGFNGKIVDYYHHQTLREVLAARHFFLNFKEANKERVADEGKRKHQHSVLNPSSTDLSAVCSASMMLVYAACLHILHGNRPYALSRRSHPITPYAPSGEFEYRSLIERLKEKVSRSLESTLPEIFVEGKIYHRDATSWWPSEVDNLDAVITSPPFFDSTRFYLANWLRLWFSGWSDSDFKKQPQFFIDERQKIEMTVYESIIRQAKERLRHGGVLVFHLGKSKKCDMAVELVKVAKKWFAHADAFDESVVHCESHGIRDKGTVTDHQYLILH